MINKKGENNGILTALLGLFIVLTVGFALFQGAAAPTAEQTTLYMANNVTVTAAAANSSVSIPGRENTTAIIVTNRSNSANVISTNFTVSYMDSGGNLRLALVTNDRAASYIGQAVNVTYQYKPAGYQNDASSQAVAGLPLLFMAIALVVVTAGVAWKFLGDRS